MIEIDQDSKKVRLIQDEEQIECDLLIAYICPKCEKILLAYWRDNSTYDPLQWLPKKDIEHQYNEWYEYYISFSAPNAIGIELQNHNRSSECPKIYQNLSLLESVRRFIYEIGDRDKYRTLSEVRLLKQPSVKAVIKFLRKRNAEFVPDVCGREDPMLILDPYQFHREDEKRHEFLAFFGLVEGEEPSSEADPTIQGESCLPKDFVREITICPGNVSEVTQKEDLLLVPLIPLGRPETEPLVITVIYDLIEKGVSFRKVKEYFKDLIPSGLTKQLVTDYIKKSGRYVKPEESESQIISQTEEEAGDLQRSEEEEINKNNAEDLQEGPQEPMTKTREKKGKKVIKQWDVPSHTSANKTYRVTKYSDGSYACSCKHWVNRHTDCSHIKRKERGKKSGQRTLFG